MINILIRRSTAYGFIVYTAPMKIQKKHISLVGIFFIGIAALYVMQPNDTDEQWQSILTEQQYTIMREAGTEQPFSSPLNEEKRAGTYYDATGEQALFRSEDKFDSGTGWPSFTKPINETAIVTKTDWSIGIPRTEVLSSDELHHIGHVFKDGPEPTGLRYCMNGTALKFVPDDVQN